MQRKIIRIIGTCLAAAAGMWSRNAMSATTLSTLETSGKAGHANYRGRITTPVIAGFHVGNMPIVADCSPYETPSGITINCNGWSPDTTCYDSSSNGSSGTGSGIGTSGGDTGTTTNGSSTSTRKAEVSLRCEWYKCIKNGGKSVESCNGEGRCDMTGIFCSNSGMFAELKLSGADPNKYWNAESTVWSHDAPISGDYQFVNCDNGWYLTKNSKPCDGFTGNTSYGVFSGCCSPCPGLKDFVPHGAGVTTYVHGTDVNSNSAGYSWLAVSGVGITTCRGYLPQESYSDTGGTYTIDACVYSTGSGTASGTGN